MVWIIITGLSNARYYIIFVNCFLFVIIVCWSASNDNIYGLLFLTIPLLIAIWLGYAAG